MVVDGGTPVLTQLGTVDYRAPHTNRPGAAGTAVITFSAVQTGMATVVLHYVRPWSKSMVAETFTFKVGVR